MEELIKALAGTDNLALLVAAIAWLMETRHTSRLETRLDTFADKAVTALESQANTNEKAAAAVEALSREVERLNRER